MKKLLLILLFPLAAFAADPVPPAPGPDWQAIATVMRQQRDGATQAMQDAQAQLALASQQIATLQKQITDAAVAAVKASKKPAPKK